MRGTHLVNELSSVVIAWRQDLRPKFQTTTLDEIACLVLEHRIVVGDGDELIVAEALGIGNVGEVRVTLFTVLADHKRLVELIQSYHVNNQEHRYNEGNEY